MGRADRRARWLLVRLLPGVSRPLTIAVGAAALLAGILPTAFVVASGAVVGSLPGAVRGGWSSPAGHRLGLALAVAAALFAVQQVLSPLVDLLGRALGRRLTGELRRRAMNASSSPVGMAHLEDPALLDQLSLVRGVGPGTLTPTGAVEGAAMIAAQRIEALTSAFLVAHFRWWLGLLLVAVCVFARSRLLGDFLKSIRVLTGRADELRRSDYYRNLALMPPAAKEVRIFGLPGWVGERFRVHWLAAMVGVWRHRRTTWAPVVQICVLLTAAYVLALVTIARAAVDGEIALGAVVVLVQAAVGVSQFSSLQQWDVQVEYGAASIPAVLALEEAAAGVARDTPAGTRPAADVPVRELRFEGVRFRYPGSDLDVYDGLDLTVPAGRSLALVGVNGAGKTTLVKLLARLYDPVAGRITVDGVDLRDLDPEAWRRRMAVIFQDFARYQLPVTDNIAFGAPESARAPGAVEEAARRAGADTIIRDLPHGWDTVLSRQFSKGTDLSGGQWQRVALARALFSVQAGAGLLVLDEPTANLDVRAEADLFDRFLDLTRGLTTILISHRFSTVRRADRICVLDHGRVVACGTHDELVAAGGLYAEMFQLQAARFIENGNGRTGPSSDGGDPTGGAPGGESEPEATRA